MNKNLEFFGRTYESETTGESYGAKGAEPLFIMPKFVRLQMPFTLKINCYFVRFPGFFSWHYSPGLRGIWARTESNHR